MEVLLYTMKVNCGDASNRKSPCAKSDRKNAEPTYFIFLAAAVDVCC